MYAIITTGGKQYKVSPGQIIDVERLPGDEGTTVELNDVLMVADGEQFSIGKPKLDGTKVTATILNQGRGKKIIVFKYKSKTRYRRKTGHRQYHTRLTIDQIIQN